MIAERPRPMMTPAEYFIWEEQQDLRYEYIDGEVYGMTGGSLAHSGIGVNIVAIFRAHLRGSQCRVFNSDGKVGISTEGPFTYPDISVTCDDRDKTAQNYIAYPTLIIEILSPGTEGYDRGGKFALYRQLSSLKEYGLISSTSIAIDIFGLNLAGKWELSSYGSGDEVQFITLDLTLPIEQVYEDLNVAPGRARSR
ncbi:MAG: Uma2 family endonuclease [Synechococcales cyanobacterium CRU_2_2]|nr:Uma2 family endonuclease [Synechococcales cyanobacterium CRU_2_2]